MEFRQQALSKLQSPEELDLPVRLARPRGRLVLAVTALVTAAAAYWAVTGTVSATLSAPAVLTHARGGYVLQSPYAGQITEVLAKEGQVLAAGAPLLKVRTERGDRVVRVLAAGRLTALRAAIGTVVATGADVAGVERTGGAGDPLVAMVYVPGDGAASLPVGARVDLTVQSVPSRRYGVLRGRVAAVGRAAQTPEQVSAFLGDAGLGGELTRHGRPVAVLVRLDRAATASGLRWSSAQGPPRPVDSMTPASATVHLADRRPLDWLLP
ncbi:hypothetical protein ACFWXK_36340 [Streptomyces sp. NPDC059070]|uniref:hypothetical protein n=1 Tax=Streptomyces sp. NPDC059070 TaxID=3346713 RepID=UPI0036906B4D